MAEAGVPGALKYVLALSTLRCKPDRRVRACLRASRRSGRTGGALGHVWQGVGLWMIIGGAHSDGRDTGEFSQPERGLRTAVSGFWAV